MRTGLETLQYYLALFAERTGSGSSDVRFEIRHLCEDLDSVIDTLDERLARLEHLEQDRVATPTPQSPYAQLDQAAVDRGELHNLEVSLYDIYSAGEYTDGDTFTCRGEDARQLFAAFVALWPHLGPGGPSC